MIFSKRHKLVEEYYKWLTEDAKDCPLNVITFLDSKGLLLDAPGNTQQQVQADSDKQDSLT